MTQKKKQKSCFASVLTICLLLTSSAMAEPVHALAMVGTPKYEDGFTHFDYVNPSAPQGGTLRLGVAGSYDSLNPFIVRGTAPIGVNTGQFSLVYETLMGRSWDEPFSLYGLVAEKADMASDRSSISFYLRPQARWSDGVALTTADVLFSHALLRDKGRPNHRTYYSKVESAEECGPSCVRFTFKKNTDGSIDREMPLIIGLMPLLPKHVWEGKDFNVTSLTPPVGSGPYRITHVEPGRSLTFTRNRNYWGKDLPIVKGIYNFDAVILDFYRDDAMALQSFKAGQYDVRRELNFSKWTTDYDMPAVKDGRIVLERLAHSRTETLNGFVYNTRRPLFADPALRVAMMYAFDSGWIGKNLFYDLCLRTQSYFPNSELASTGLPEGEERVILEHYQDKLPPDIFTQSVAAPQTDGSEESLRQNLLTAKKRLKEAGYKIENEKLVSPSGKTVSFEIMLNDPVQEKIALQWVRQLRRLGIQARARTVDSAQYQERLAGFDYDVTVVKWNNSLSPGNEQMLFWGSAAANQPGSRNYPGIRDDVVDALAKAIPSAQSRETLVATTHALDRVLMRGAYIVPFFYSNADMMAYWKKVQHPQKTPLYGAIVETWWAQP